MLLGLCWSRWLHRFAKIVEILGYNSNPYKFFVILNNQSVVLKALMTRSYSLQNTFLFVSRPSLIFFLNDKLIQHSSLSVMSIIRFIYNKQLFSVNFSTNKANNREFSFSLFKQLYSETTKSSYTFCSVIKPMLEIIGHLHSIYDVKTIFFFI